MKKQKAIYTKEKVKETNELKFTQPKAVHWPRIFKNYFAMMLVMLVVLGFLMRIINVGNVPAGLNRDEAALAYNALLLKETGKDEWQQSWPLALESFGDYKLPGYPWILIGVFSVTGYQDWAVRLPSVIAGTFLIVCVALFAKKVLSWSDPMSVMAAGLITIEPVFFFYSRIAFEANIALMLMMLSLLLWFWRNAQNRFWRDLIGVASWLLAIFTYNTPFLLLPFVVLGLIAWRGVRQPKKWLMVVVSCVVIFGVGLSSFLAVSQQKSGITIFSDESIWKQSVDYRASFTGIAQKTLGSRYVFFSRIMISNYVKTFSPPFLVQQGGAHPWHTLPGFGHLDWGVYGLAVVGIVSAFAHLLRRKFIREELLLAFLTMIAPLPAVVTVDAPHATRSLLVFVLLVCWSILGLMTIRGIITNKNMRVAVAVILVILIGGSASNYYQKYLQNYPAHSALLFHPGLGNALRDASQKNPHQPIAVIDPDGFEYIQAAWDLRISPTDFFATIQKHLPDKIGFRYGYKLLNYRFIVDREDHFETEKVLVRWDDQKAAWQLESLD